MAAPSVRASELGRSIKGSVVSNKTLKTETSCGQCYMKEREESGKNIIRFHLGLSLVGFFSTLAATIWDLTSGNQSLSGRCVWAGYCVWKGTLISCFLCLLLLLVNSLALSGIFRASSWHETKPRNSYRFILPWLVLYFVLDIAILPVCIYCLFTWYTLTDSNNILHIYIPIISIFAVGLLCLCLHHWFKIMNLCFKIRDRVKVEPFTRVGDRIVLGLVDPSVYSISNVGSVARSSAKLSSNKSKLIGNVSFT